MSVKPDIRDFDGPLDLLHQLIAINRIDIYDIPISLICDQYMAYMDQLKYIDMDLSSEFLVMAATLMQIKSRTLLPKTDAESEEDDPREELVLRLLAYRRNKSLAEMLQREHAIYGETFLKVPETPDRLGLSIEYIEDPLKFDEFLKAVNAVNDRNSDRFNAKSRRIQQLLKRERFSVKDKMVEIFDVLMRKSRLFFNELFPTAKSSKPERISGFLAILELIRQNRIRVKQPNPFSVMLIEKEPGYRGNALGTLPTQEEK